MPARQQPAPQTPVVVEEPAEGITAMSETLIIQRMWTRRRP
jgi:hypothetical protein